MNIIHNINKDLQSYYVNIKLESRLTKFANKIKIVSCINENNNEIISCSMCDQHNAKQFHI